MEAILPDTPDRDPADRSGTDARAALIASLAEHVRALTEAGDLAAAKVAAEALVQVLGLPLTERAPSRAP